MMVQKNPGTRTPLAIDKCDLFLSQVFKSLEMKRILGGDHESEVPMKEIDDNRFHIREELGEKRDVIFTALGDTIVGSLRSLLNCSMFSPISLAMVSTLASLSSFWLVNSFSFISQNFPCFPAATAAMAAFLEKL